MSLESVKAPFVAASSLASQLPTVSLDKAVHEGG